MRWTLIAALSIVLGPALAIGDEKPVRHLEKDAGFSFVSPKGWTLTDAAAMAKSAAPIKEEAEKGAQLQNLAIQRQKQFILEQLKLARPGTPLEKMLREQVVVLEKQAKQQLDAAKQVLSEENPILICSSPAAKEPAPSIRFYVLKPANNAKDKVEKITLADVVAKYKHVAKNTNPYSSLVAERKFKTDEGVECVVVVAKVFPATYFGPEDDRVEMRNTHYISELSPGRVLVVTCSAASEDAKVDTVFEASLKTLRLEKP